MLFLHLLPLLDVKLGVGFQAAQITVLFLAKYRKLEVKRQNNNPHETHFVAGPSLYIVQAFHHWSLRDPKLALLVVLFGKLNVYSSRPLLRSLKSFNCSSKIAGVNDHGSQHLDLLDCMIFG